MTGQLQPTRNSCGQTCVAMLLGVPARDVIAEMGDRPTHAYELAAYLRARGFQVSPPRRARGAMPELAIAKVAWRAGTRTHWILVDRGRVLDPAGIVRDVRLSRRPIGWRVVSCMEIGRP